MPASSRSREAHTVGTLVPTKAVLAILVLTAIAGIVGRHVGAASVSVSPVPPKGASQGSEAPAAEVTHIFNVYPDPVPRAMLTAEDWWNRSGANVELAVASSPSAASVVIGPYRNLGGSPNGLTESGVTTMPCTAPCRPSAPETITLSTDDQAPEFTLVHELSHAMGMARTHVDSCSVMAPVLAEHCPSTNLSARIPAPDRNELLAIWGLAPTSDTNEGSGA